jgi:hypothetical protein
MYISLRCDNKIREYQFIKLTTGAAVSTSVVLPFFLFLAAAASFFLSSTLSSGVISIVGGSGGGTSTEIMFQSISNAFIKYKKLTFWCFSIIITARKNHS